MPCALLIACAVLSLPNPLSPPFLGFFTLRVPHWPQNAATAFALTGPVPVPVAGFDVISVCCLLPVPLVVSPALVALCPCAIISIMKPLPAPARIPHSPCPLQLLFSFCSWTKHAEWHEPQLRLPQPLPLSRLSGPPPPGLSAGHKLISWRINWLTDIHSIPHTPPPAATAASGCKVNSVQAKTKQRAGRDVDGTRQVPVPSLTTLSYCWRYFWFTLRTDWLLSFIWFFLFDIYLTIW